MKLVFLIDYDAAFGGGEYAQFKFAEHLAKRNHKITIITTKKNFITKQLEKQKNITIKYRPHLKVIIRKIGIGKLNRILKNIYVKKELKPLLEKEEPDWIIGYLRAPAITATQLGKELKIKVANFIFESPPWMKQQLGKLWDEELKNKKFKESWKKTKQAYKESDVLIPNSKLSGKKCKEWIPKAKVSEPVYPGVETQNIRKKIKKQLSRKYDVAYIGRLNALKNISDIIIAAKILKEKGINPKIAIAGSGEEEKNLKELAILSGVDVKFLGEINDKNKFNLLEDSKIFVFPTSFEGFGMPPLEALISRCKVLCSNIPILKEVYGDTVKYFKLNDTKDLAGKIQRILEEGKDTTNNEEKKINKLLKEYNWEVSARKIEKILRENVKK